MALSTLDMHDRDISEQSHKLWDSTWKNLAQATPPTVREILHAYTLEGKGDRDMLLSLLNAKAAEDQRIAALANLAVLQVQQSLAKFRGVVKDDDPNGNARRDGPPARHEIREMGVPKARSPAASSSSSPSLSSSSRVTHSFHSIPYPPPSAQIPSSSASGSSSFRLPPMRTLPNEFDADPEFDPRMQRPTKTRRLSPPIATSSTDRHSRSPTASPPLPRSSLNPSGRARAPPSSSSASRRAAHPSSPSQPSTYYPSSRGKARDHKSGSGSSSSEGEDHLPSTEDSRR